MVRVRQVGTFVTQLGPTKIYTKVTNVTSY